MINESDREENLQIAKVEIMSSQLQHLPNLSTKQFNRKFICLKDEDIKLDFEIEVCIDEKNKLFVRHHVLTLIYGLGIGIISNDVNQKSENYISRIENKCRQLSNPLRWIGYQCCCEDVLLFDEDNLEMKVQAIMLPLRMFIDLLENL
ncbi:MAG: hypothetical protein ACRC11_22600, partial [Xenococcaceae cyanobacterium]